MHLLPELMISILEFCANVDPVLALLIMARTGALHYRNACAHILYRFAVTEQSSPTFEIPRLLSESWICSQGKRPGPRNRNVIVESVIRAGITVPGRSCPLWCYKESEVLPWDPRPDVELLPWFGASSVVARPRIGAYGWAPMISDQPGYTASGRVQGEKTWWVSMMGTELVLRVHDWDRGSSDISEWARTAGAGASLWQKAAVYGGSAWLQPVEDLPFRIRPGQATRRPHPEALKELAAAGFIAPRHYITWASQITDDLRDMLLPIFERFPEAHVGGSYPLFLMLGGPADLSGPCSMGWVAGGIDLYLGETRRPAFPAGWGLSMEIGGREAFKPPFLRGATLYVIYSGAPSYGELDLEVCDIALVRMVGGFMLGCSERSVLSLLTGVVRGWADKAISAERVKKYSARGFEMRLGAGGSADAKDIRFPAYALGRWWG
jgi:hypothetical protein